MERVQCLFSVLLLMSLFHSQADAQANAITSPPLGDTLRDNLKTTIIVTMFGFFCALVFMGFFQLYLCHCTNAYRNPITTVCGGSDNREAIDKCPVFAYSTVKDLRIGRGAVECAVCLNEFEDSDNLRLLPKCDHVFHVDCIDGWLFCHMTCPVCRSKVSHDGVDNTIPIDVPTEQGERSETVTESGVEVGTHPETEIETERTETEETVTGCSEESRRMGMLPRSYSTGHSLVGPEEDVRGVDRFTLRLPEHVKKEILVKNGRLRIRCVLPGEWTSKRSWIRDRWALSMTPPFVAQTTCFTPPLTMSFNAAPTSSHVSAV